MNIVPQLMRDQYRISPVRLWQKTLFECRRSEFRLKASRQNNFHILHPIFTPSLPDTQSYKSDTNLGATCKTYFGAMPKSNNSLSLLLKPPSPIKSSLKLVLLSLLYLSYQHFFSHTGLKFLYLCQNLS